MVVPVQEPILCASSCSGTEVRALSDRGGGGLSSKKELFKPRVSNQLVTGKRILWKKKATELPTYGKGRNKARSGVEEFDY
jgi:hypothetical protein